MAKASEDSIKLDLRSVVERSFPLFRHIEVPTKQSLSSVRHVWYDEGCNRGRNPAVDFTEGQGFTPGSHLPQLRDKSRRENLTQIFRAEAHFGSDDSPESLAQFLLGQVLGQLEWAILNHRGPETLRNADGHPVRRMGGLRHWIDDSRKWVSDMVFRERFVKVASEDSQYLHWVARSPNMPPNVDSYRIHPSLVRLKALRPFTAEYWKGDIVAVLGEYTLEVWDGNAIDPA